MDQETDKNTNIKYAYEAISLEFNAWKGRYDGDYLEIINERGQAGWRFVGFSPAAATPKEIKGIDLIFEKKIVHP